jgi:hypothetical protein
VTLRDPHNMSGSKSMTKRIFIVTLDTFTMVPTPSGFTAAISTLRLVILSLSIFMECPTCVPLTNTTITRMCDMDEFG